MAASAEPRLYECLAKMLAEDREYVERVLAGEPEVFEHLLWLISKQREAEVLREFSAKH